MTPAYPGAPHLEKPPPPYAVTKRAVELREAARETMRDVASRRTWRHEPPARPLEVRPGPHPYPFARVELADLKGSAKSIAAHAASLGLAVVAATDGRDVEVRVGTSIVLGRARFRDGRLVHAFALAEGPRYVKVTLAALKASLAEAAA